jgi:hypothetical protein
MGVIPWGIDSRRDMRLGALEGEIERWIKFYRRELYIEE